MSESVGSVSRRDGRDSILESLNEVGNGKGSKLTDAGFNLGEEVFYRVEIRRVGRQIKKSALPSFDKLSDSFVVMDGEVIHNDGLSWLERWA